MSDTATRNGRPADLGEAVAVEEAIRLEAEELRREAKDLTPPLFMDLWPLLRRPIPDAFIVTTGVVKGKPYPSTGVKSIQVITDRMDAVLSPLWWWDEAEYFEEGKLARVRVFVGSDRTRPLFSRESFGGVNQASTLGNLHKGSYTNAAKRAFAQVGVAHAVYLGATDFDPDTDTDAAKAQERPAQAPVEGAGPIGEERAKSLLALVDDAGRTDHLEAKLRGFGVKTAAELTEAQGLKLVEWAGAA